MHAAKIALIFIAACAVWTTATAQKVYKCGSSYSQVPCPDGTPIQVEDARTPADKAAATRLSKAEAAQGQALEKERLQDEARARAADQAQAKANALEKKVVTTSGTGKPKAKKSKEPEYFTAKPPPPAKN